jgi:hypothetical protein
MGVALKIEAAAVDSPPDEDGGGAGHDAQCHNFLPVHSMHHTPTFSPGNLDVREKCNMRFVAGARNPAHPREDSRLTDPPFSSKLAT